MGFHVTSFNVRSDATPDATAGSTIPLTGFGFQPTFIGLAWMGGTESVDANGSGNIVAGYGYVGGPTNRICIGAGSQDGVATGDVFTDYATTACVIEIDPDGPSTTGALDLQSFDADGATFVVDDEFVDDLRVLVWATDEVTNVATGVEAVPSGSQGSPISVTSPAFQGNLLLASNPWTSGAAQLFRLAFAAATDLDQFLVDAVGTQSNPSDTNRFARRGLIARRTAAFNDKVTFDAFTASGFDYNKSGSNSMEFIWCVLDVPQVHIGNVTSATDTSTFSETGVPFTPELLLLVSHALDESALDTNDADGLVSFGAATSPTNRAAHGMTDQDNVSPTEGWTAVEHDAVYVEGDFADGVVRTGDITAINSDGFDMQMSAAGAAAFVPYVAIAGAGVQGATGSIFTHPTPTLDGPAVQVGDGTVVARNLFFDVGSYATPFWVRPDGVNARTQRVDSLPATLILHCGQIEVLSSAPV